jgi:hypothetical protein
MPMISNLYVEHAGFDKSKETHLLGRTDESPILSRFIHVYCAILHFRCVFDSFFGDRSCPHCKRSVSSFPHWTQHEPVDPAQANGAQQVRMRRIFNGNVEE